MKKLFTSLFLCMFLFGLLVSANTPDLPYSINGKASLTTGECVTGFDVIINAMDYSSFPFKEKELTVPVNNNCEYNFALGNPPLTKWMEGMEITLLFCDKDLNPNCEKTIIIGQGGCEKGGGCVIDFTLQPTDLVSTPDGNVPASSVVKEIQCWDGSIVNNINDCPDEEEPEGISVLWKILIATAIAILGLFGWSKGFTALANYYYKKGQELEKQGHPVLAKKEYERATKMLKTALKKAAEGKYKK